MKNTKKLPTLLLASIMTAGTVSSLSAGAGNVTGYDKDELAKKIENSDYYIPEDENYYISNVYVTKKEKADSNGSYEFVLFQSDYNSPNKISIKINKSDLEKTEGLIKKLVPEAVINQSEDEEGSCFISIAGFSEGSKMQFEETYKKEITLAQASDLYAKLSEIADIQSINDEKVNAHPAYGSTFITDFDINPYDNKIGENIEKLEKYLADIDMKCHVEVKKMSVAVIPDEEVSAADLAALSKQIQDDLGFKQFILVLGTENESKSTFIDLHANVKGDANDDGNLALSDAITIMQTVGNPDEYKLTAQGEYNADIAGDSDGITNLDALTIQRKLLKLE